MLRLDQQGRGSSGCSLECWQPRSLVVAFAVAEGLHVAVSWLCLSALCNLELLRTAGHAYSSVSGESSQPWGKLIWLDTAKQVVRRTSGLAWCLYQEQPAGRPRRQTREKAVWCLQAGAPRGSSSMPYVPTVRWGSAAAQGQRYAMEDAHIAVPSLEEYAGRAFDEPGAHAFFGVSAPDCWLLYKLDDERGVTAAASVSRHRVPAA